MESEFVGEELQRAINASEEIRTKEVVTSNIDVEIAELEKEYRSNPSLYTKTQLMSRYILVSKWLSVLDSNIAIEIRERFQAQFPEHFSVFMNSLKATGVSARWAGCLLCKYTLGHGCEKGLQPHRLPSRYLNRDYGCSAFEAKTG